MAVGEPAQQAPTTIASYCVHYLSGVLKGIEADRDVKGVVGPGQILHLTEAKVALRCALTRDL
jgi:hypothetical protein